jgi:hypothetical protein
MRPLQAQNEIENVFVETYYVSDANDATDIIGGGLETGSRTYRIYLDLCSGCTLRSIYGDDNHTLSITSSALIFNHIDRGRTYGHEINNSALDEGVVALDSWLSLGAASNQRRGIPKSDDPDGSIVGAENNDGGSSEIPGGLLVNVVDEMGGALFERDGLTSLGSSAALPPNFNVLGDDPSSAFDDATLLSGFVSNDTRIGCSLPGTQGATTENKVLIAQITTLGDLSFLLNVEIQRADGAVVKFVSDGSTLLEGEVVNGLLVYPPQCGCTDPDFAEYDPNAGCDDGSCATPVVFGCLDSLACNYDPTANFNVPQLCCYGPDDCNGLDINLICTGIGLEELRIKDISVHPNPVQDILYVDLGSTRNERLEVVVLNSFGAMERVRSIAPGEPRSIIEVEDLPPGVHHLRISDGRSRVNIMFIKS